MRLSLVVCLLVVLGAACLASSSPSSQREKRIFGKIKKAFKKVVDTVDDAIDTSVDFVKDTADDVKDGVVDVAKYTTKISKSVGKGVASISKKAYRVTYNKAKKTFEAIRKIPKSVNFDKAVDKLLPELVDMIDSSLSNAICEQTCIKGATKLMGPGAEIFAEVACAPVCEA
ncbi:hypothetical protein ElyMa_006831900 [Elysia marginata]|uniref:Uncharacterized protein n=1 Tax=Elysia marginata TaxID=1093978 RepID=A0AAV4J8Z5_9GAST|nr:hypothetical protein ElyMa_006831900 [Elysia marginata]